MCESLCRAESFPVPRARRDWRWRGSWFGVVFQPPSSGCPRRNDVVPRKPGVNDVQKAIAIRIRTGADRDRAHVDRRTGFGAGLRRDADTAAVRGPGPAFDPEWRM